MKLFGKELRKILDELNKRDLKEVETAKLYDLALKYIELLKKEEISLKLKENIVADIVEEWEA